MTIAVVGPTLYRVIEAADILQEKYGISTEVIDLRFVAPLNLDPIVASVKKTGRLVLTSDAVDRGSFLHTVASQIQTLAFDHLDAPSPWSAPATSSRRPRSWRRSSSRRPTG
nr:transketolase C-terminal domain-containing protein [Tessaracoccus coleopterorum]